MQNAAYGTYIDGQVVLAEPAPVTGETDVIVVFLNEAEKSRKNLLDAFNTWQDPRSATEIVESIRSSRINPLRDAQL
jgi:hypothetical protein